MVKETGIEKARRGERDNKTQMVNNNRERTESQRIVESVQRKEKRRKTERDQGRQMMKEPGIRKKENKKRK